MSVSRRTFQALPTEVIAEVLGYCSSPELVVACRTSKRISSIATRHLYSNILLRGITSAVWCFRTLASHPQCALLVKKLCWEHTPARTTSAFPALCKLIARALRWTANLQVLDIPHPFPTLSALIGTLHFPRLTTSGLVLDPNSLDFVRTHAGTLSRIGLYDHHNPAHDGAISPETSRALEGVRFPQLRSLLARAHLVPHFAARADTIESAAIPWSPARSPGSQDPSSVLASLADHPVAQISHRMADFDVDVTRGTAEHLGERLQLLEIQLTSIRPSDIQAMYESLMHVLPSFKCLKEVHIWHASRRLANHNTVWRALDEELSILTRWKRHCPTLATASLGSRLVRWTYCAEAVAWYPNLVRVAAERDEHQVQMVVVWLIFAVANGLLPNAGRCLQDLRKIYFSPQRKNYPSLRGHGLERFMGVAA
ncbi:hypothetical protein BD626DRAFT_575231 [Schizophyllum amplum]|uniref:F-box domain-containing protein n=1 Tax=Schizophyllum amplum TaxID=97359 RepID=A0A550BW59_9AGAR|nr:hypothetical protein BD626DRAFT_575231 [Auriculariopsis ampla]